MSSYHNQAIAYRPEIDGLRAIAVLPVILFHAGFELFSGGYVGVDVFFVISGYLITSIILREMEQGKFSIVRFYERRARRILPALFFVIACCLPFAWMWMLPDELKRFGQSLVAVATFSSNIYFWRNTDYFAPAAEEQPLLHTWSLAVEEQYYVLFPLFLMLCWRFGKSKVFWLTAFVAICSLMLAEWGWRNSPVANFYLLPTRAWELLAGSLIAFIPVELAQRAKEHAKAQFLSLSGFVMIVYSIFFFDSKTPLPSLYTAVPILGSVFVIVYTKSTGVIGSLLSSRPFVAIGLMSYSAYLWHQPLFAFAKQATLNQVGSELRVLLLVFTFILSLISLNFVEKPFRTSRSFSRAKIFRLSVVALSMTFTIGIATHLAKGFAGDDYVILEAMEDWGYPSKLNKENLKGFYKSSPTKPIEVLFFGDSHAEQLWPAIRPTDAESLSVGFLTGGGCPPIPNLLDDLHPHCFDMFQRFENVIKQERHIKTIIITGCFNCYFIDQALKTPRVGDEYNYYFLKGSERLYLRQGLGMQESVQSLSNFLESLSKYEVILLGDNPSGDNFDPKVMLRFKKMGDSKFFKSRYPDYQEGEFKVSSSQIVLDETLRKNTPKTVDFISQISLICPNETCNAVDEKSQPLYKDANHIRTVFARRFLHDLLMEMVVSTNEK